MASNLGARLRLLDSSEPADLEFADHLRNARIQGGANQAELAAELGVSRTTLVEWEQGRAVPIRGIVIAIAALTGYKISMLLGAWEIAWAEQAARDKRRTPGFRGGATKGASLRMLRLVDENFDPQEVICAQSIPVDDVIPDRDLPQVGHVAVNAVI